MLITNVCLISNVVLAVSTKSNDYKLFMTMHKDYLCKHVDNCNP
jgi:hypothetical protein